MHRHYTNTEAEEVVGRTREGYQKTLFGAIEAGDFPQWTVQVQIITEARAQEFPFHPFDVTKVWPHADFPPVEIGVLELNRKGRPRREREDPRGARVPWALL